MPSQNSLASFSQSYLGLVVLFAIFTGWPVSFTEGAVFHVSPGGSGNGSAWNDTTNLQRALRAARGGDEIWIEAGVYYPDEGSGQTNNDSSSSFMISSGVAILGGFAGSEASADERDPVSNLTVLSGDLEQDDDDDDGDGVIDQPGDVNGTNAAHVVTVFNLFPDPVLLDGVTITAGRMTSENGAGMWLRRGTTVEVSRCQFVGNFGDEGGAAFIESDLQAVQFTATRFTSNRGNTHGGAIFADRTLCHLSDCLFSGNRSGGDGGAIYLFGSDPEWTNCTFSGNRADSDGGAIRVLNSRALMRNCILWANSSDGSTSTVKASFAATVGVPIFDHCLVQNVNLSGGNGNFDGTLATNDPLFIVDLNPNTAPSWRGDFRLSDGSPLIDQGSATGGVGATDVDGYTRIMSGQVDLGAHESRWRLFVDESVTGGDGFSWGSAMHRLQNALAVISPIDPAEIWVAQGIYRPDEGAGQTNNDPTSTFQIRDKVFVYGGFSGGEEERDARRPDLNLTVLSGDIDRNDTRQDGVTVHWSDQAGTNAHNVVTVIAAGEQGAALSGFTITGGHAIEVGDEPNGGGLIVSNSILDLSQTSFYGNRAVSGGGFSAQESNLTLSDATISGNQATGIGTGSIDGSGGGAEVDLSEIIADDVEFVNNEAESFGGALFRIGPGERSVFTNCRFSGNQARSQGGAIVELGFSDWEDHIDDEASYINCLISGNSSNLGVGGATYLARTSPRFINSTISGNLSSSGNGGVHINNAESRATFQNTIIWGNRRASKPSTPANLSSDSLGILTIQRCLIEGIDLPAELPAEVNMDGADPGNDPQFANPLDSSSAPNSGGYYQLRATSPAIDQGLKSFNTTTTDLDGNTRSRAGEPIDLGAYENDASLQPDSEATDFLYFHVGSPQNGSFNLTDIFGVAAADIRDLVVVSTPDAGLAQFDVEIGDNISIDEYGNQTIIQSPTGTVDYEVPASAAASATVEFLLFTTTGTGVYTVVFQVVPPVVYVDSTATGLNDGSSWANAFTTLQDALGEAVPLTEQQIWVAKGSYYPDEGGGAVDNARGSTFQLVDGVAIYGGFPSGGAAGLGDRNDSLYPTILSGDLDQDDVDGVPDTQNAYNVVNGSGVSSAAVLDGFTVSGGRADGSDEATARGGGIYVVDGSPQIWDCILEGNHASEASGPGGGGALYVGGDSYPRFTDCLFQFNQARGGGAIYVQGASLALEGCEVVENHSAERAGGAIRVSGSPELLATACRFSGNSSGQYGGALYITDNSACTFTNCLFSGNRADRRGGAIATFASSTSPQLTTMINCTFSGNRGSGGGAIGMDGGNAIIENSLIWNNRVGSGTTAASSSLVRRNGSESVVVEHSLVANFTPQTLTGLGGADNLDGTDPANDPRFRSPIDTTTAPTTSGDFQLFLNSPVVDAGDPAANTTPSDLDGNPRQQGAGIDLGAYELSPQIVASPDSMELIVPLGGALNHLDVLDIAEFFTGDPDNYEFYQSSDPALVTADLAPVDEFSFVGSLSDGSVHGVSCSPDGKHVYTASLSNAVSVFERNALTGNLQFVAAYRNGGTDEAGTTLDSLQNARTTVVSPDGRFVMVAASLAESLTVFARDASTGRLTLVEVLQDLETDQAGNQVTGIDGVHSLAVTADGAFLYAVGKDDHSLVIFERNLTSGILTFVTTYIDGGQDEAGATIDGLRGSRWVTVSPDDQHVYVAAETDDAVSVFARNALSGRLTFVQAAINNGDDGSGSTVRSLDGATSVALSPDGLFVYASGANSNGLAVFSRNPATGQLSWVRRYRSTGKDEEGNELSGLEWAKSVHVSPDGKNLYAVSYNSKSLLAFSRNPADGKLTLHHDFRDAEDDGSGAIVSGLVYPQAVVVSPDSKHIYTAASGSGAIAAFRRDHYAGQVDVNLTDTSAGSETSLWFSGTSGSAGDLFELRVRVDEVEATVLGRHLFYNQSSWDGNNAEANADDDNAIATDKSALLAGGAATFANYSSYSRGINGIMVDIADLAGTPTVADFEFKVGNDQDPSGWTAAPTPTVTVREAAGESGSDRVTITWGNNAIHKCWLQVTVKATANTGLVEDDVHYWGNAIGDTCNRATDAAVNASDEIKVRANGRTSANLAPIDDLYDINRDRVVNATDEIKARANGTTSSTMLVLLDLSNQAGAVNSITRSGALMQNAAARVARSTGSRTSDEMDASAEANAPPVPPVPTRTIEAPMTMHRTEGGGIVLEFTVPGGAILQSSEDMELWQTFEVESEPGAWSEGEEAILVKASGTTRFFRLMIH